MAADPRRYADSDTQERQLAEHHIMVSYRDEYAGGWKPPFVDPSVTAELDSPMRDRFIIGGPERCMAQIQRFIEAFGVTQFICRLFFPGMPHAHIMHELERLAWEVMPAFQ
jgi:alkanesulfonate monooxygenase SsuD/methylene tetrahydromethanopterin reductase-like flavin-dependent oxidoreductase (luciferase family)